MTYPGMSRFLLGMGQIVNREKLLEEVQKAHANGETVVLAEGAFDIFHVGHLRYLRGAKELGDVLVVAVWDDRSVRALKGEGRPVVPLEDRMTIVAAMEPVDYVSPFGGETAEEILRELKPAIFAKGTDCTAETVPEKDVVASYGGKIAIVGDPKRHSSAEIIGRMAEKR